MQFPQVHQRLIDCQTRSNALFVHVPKGALHGIYQHIVATGAKDCLELGTAYGATTCVMAAAVEEIGGGSVTTVDQIARKPTGVTELADAVGLSRYVHPVILRAGYNWFLLDVLRRQTRGRIIEPCYDFCFLDGAHFWEPDGLAALVVVRLLRPGGWLLVDDLHWNPRCHPGWEAAFGQLSPDELATRGVAQVYDLLLKTHPDLGHFVLANEGHMGWCRKSGGGPVTALPGWLIASAVQGSWSRTIAAAVAIGDAPTNHHATVAPCGDAVMIRAAENDPWIEIRTPSPSRKIDYITLRLRLVAPEIEMAQLFWIAEHGTFFNEDSSLRCLIRSSEAAQDLTFCVSDGADGCVLKGLRLDPGDGPCEMLVESVTYGVW